MGVYRLLFFAQPDHNDDDDAETTLAELAKLAQKKMKLLARRRLPRRVALFVFELSLFLFGIPPAPNKSQVLSGTSGGFFVVLGPKTITSRETGGFERTRVNLFAAGNQTNKQTPKKKSSSHLTRH